MRPGWLELPCARGPCPPELQDESRDIHRDQILQGEGPAFGVYSKSDGNPWEGSKHLSAMTVFTGLRLLCKEGV